MNSLRRFLRAHGVEPTHMIIGIDPGNTTGLFMLTLHGDDTAMVRYDQFESFNVSTWLDLVFQLANDCGVPENRRHIAIEKYTITQRTAKLTRQPAAIEVTGIARDYGRFHKAHVWQFQPSITKKFAPDERLEIAGWFDRKSRRRERHARDAARQVWQCLMEVSFPSWKLAYSGKMTTVVSNDASFDQLDGEKRSGDVG